MITDPDRLWPHAWLRACAVYGAGMLNIQELAGDIAHLLPTGDQKTMTEPTLYGDQDIVRESAAWALHRIAPEHFLEYTPALLDDPNPLVRHLAAEATKGTE